MSSAANKEPAEPPLDLGRNLRACLRCRLLKSFSQFYENGCENCPFVGKAASLPKQRAKRAQGVCAPSVPMRPFSPSLSDDLKSSPFLMSIRIQPAVSCAYEVCLPGLQSNPFFFVKPYTRRHLRVPVSLATRFDLPRP
eukprot:5830171-Pyramimonas_sp.AAC.1